MSRSQAAEGVDERAVAGRPRRRFPPSHLIQQPRRPHCCRLTCSIDVRISWCHNDGVSDTRLVEVGPKGRVVIPAAIRRELGIGEGSQLVALVEDGAVVLLPRSEVKRRLRGLFAAIGTSLSAELLSDRRREAQREDGR